MIEQQQGRTMVQFPWKKASSLAALVFVTTYVVALVHKEQRSTSHVVTDTSAWKDGHNGMTIVNEDPHPQQKRSLSSLKKTMTTLFQTQVTPRIVGGTAANEYPSYGFNAGSGLCGGTLIYPEYVLL